MHCSHNILMKMSFEQNHTAGKKLVGIQGVESCQAISLVECKLLIYDGMVILIQSLILCNLFPYTVSVIVIRNCILITFSPQEVFQNEQGIKLEAQFAVQPDWIPEILWNSLRLELVFIRKKYKLSKINRQIQQATRTKAQVPLQ